MTRPAACFPGFASVGKVLIGSFVVALSLTMAQTASALRYGYGPVYQYEYGYAPERLSREHRLGAELDNWLERGNATVTLSPAFDDGIRVASWAEGTESPEDYEFGLASAIYYFDIPNRARQIEVRVRYEGDAYSSEEYGAAGRVWIRDARAPVSTDDNEPLQGETFVLRPDRRSETFRVPAAKFVANDGTLELHVVATGSGRIDVAYIDVESYSRESSERIVRRYVSDYRWRPWYGYTYQYFYGGPFYYPTDYGYYLYWDFPYGSTVYVGLRGRYHSYLHHSYYSRYPRRYSSHRGYARRGTVVSRHVSRWTPQLQRVRGEYERGRGSKVKRPPAEALEQRQAVASALATYRTSPSPSTHVTGDYAKRRRGSSPGGAPLYGTRTGRGTDVTGRRATSSKLSRTYEAAPRRTAAPRDATPRTETQTKRRRTATPSPATRSYATPSARERDDDRGRTETKRRRTTTQSKSSESSSSSGSRSSSSSSSSSRSDDDDKKKRRR